MIIIKLFLTHYKVQLVDISREGCLFQIPYDPSRQEAFEEGQEINFRMYFTEASYVPVICKVRRFQEYLDSDGLLFARYGCEFDKSTSTFEAVASFIEFLYKFAEHSSIDRGDQRVFFY